MTNVHNANMYIYIYTYIYTWVRGIYIEFVYISMATINAYIYGSGVDVHEHSLWDMDMWIYKAIG